MQHPVYWAFLHPFHDHLFARSIFTRRRRRRHRFNYAAYCVCVNVPSGKGRALGRRRRRPVVGLQLHRCRSFSLPPKVSSERGSGGRSRINCSVSQPAKNSPPPPPSVGERTSSAIRRVRTAGRRRGRVVERSERCFAYLQSISPLHSSPLLTYQAAAAAAAARRTSGFLSGDVSSELQSSD